MVAKFILVALSCVLILQIHYVYAPEPDPVTETKPTNNDGQGVVVKPEDKKFSNPVADQAIHTILRHFRIIMTHPVSAFMVRYIVTTIRVVLTDVIGQKNIEHLIDTLVAILKHPNTLNIVTTVQQKLLELVKAGPSAPMVLESAAIGLKKILDEPNVLPATEGFVNGFNILLEGMTEKDLRDGLNRIKKMQKFAVMLQPFMKKTIMLPKTRKGTQRTTTTTDVPIAGEYDSDDLQARDLGWIYDKPPLVDANLESKSINIDV